MERILEQSMELFLKYGIKSISMDDISRKLGISKKTLYQHIAKKEDLVKAVINLFLRNEIEVCNEIIDSDKNAIDQLLEIGEYAKRHLRMMNPSIIYDLQKYFPECWKLIENHRLNFIYEKIQLMMERGVEDGLFRSDINIRIIAKFYISKIGLIMDADMFPIEEYRREEVYSEFLQYHIYGIASEKGLKYFSKIQDQYAK